MAKRYEISDQDLSNVVGGAFQFYKHRKTGEQMIYVDDVGAFTPTSSSSLDDIILMCAQNDGLSSQELADMAVDCGYMVPYGG